MTRGVDSGKRLFIPLLAMIANSHGTAKRGEKRHWEYVVPLDRGKLHGEDFV